MALLIALGVILVMTAALLAGVAAAPALLVLAVVVAGIAIAVRKARGRRVGPR